MTLIKSGEVLERLRDLGQPRSIPRGSSLAMEGDPALGFWWVLIGQVTIHQISPEGRQIELGRFYGGEIVAAALAFADVPFPHHIEAVCDSELLWFPRQPAWQRITGNPELASYFLRMLAGKCRLLQQRLRSRQSQTLTQRLLEYLRSQTRAQVSKTDGSNAQPASASGTVTLTITSKKDLASQLGASPETLSRALRQLRDSGELLVDGRKITLIEDRSGASGSDR